MPRQSAPVEVPRLLAATARHTQGLATHRGLLRNGVPRASLSRAVTTGAVVSVRRRVYALEALPPLPRFVVTDGQVAPEYVAHVRAVLLSLGAGAAACGRTAAELYGWGMLVVEPARTVEVAVAHGRGRVGAPGVRAYQRRSAEVARRSVLVDTAPLRLTTPVRTVLDCALGLPLLQAVVVADSALRAGDVTVEELVAATRSMRGHQGARKARRVVELCDPVLESVQRVRMVLDGLDGFGTQVLLRSLPGQQLRVDLCFDRAGLVVEVDGAKWHPDPAPDQARDNALAALGWRVLRYTWSEVVHDSTRVLAEIRAALECGTPTLQVAASGVSAAA
jgi:very-short-patch-repair endonuclease